MEPKNRIDNCCCSHEKTEEHNENCKKNEEDAEEGEEEDEKLESFHFAKVLSTISYYERYAFQQDLNLTKRNYSKLSDFQKFLLVPPNSESQSQSQNQNSTTGTQTPLVLSTTSSVETKFKALESAIQANYNFLLNIILPHITSQATVPGSEDEIKNGRRYGVKIPNENNGDMKLSFGDFEKLKGCLKQFYRDWSKEGEAERSMSYDKILKELNHQFEHIPIKDRHLIKILTPGAGLGRLTFEIAKEGYSCQGNEFSFLMLMGADYILNSIKKKEQHIIFPFIHSKSNIFSRKNQFAFFRIPDVVVPDCFDERFGKVPEENGDTPKRPDFSMVAGDFNEVYGSKNSKAVKDFDCVVTCFFIDTSRNILNYVETIWNCLKPGGIWINFGPLLYHFATEEGNVCAEDEEENESSFSVELSYEELKFSILHKGFEFIRDTTIEESTYTNDLNSLMQTIFKCLFWTVKKPKE